MKTPKKLTKVNPLSKSLILISLILLAVVVFLVGVKYKRNTTTINDISPSSSSGQFGSNYFENKKWGYSINLPSGFEIKNPDPQDSSSFIQKVGEKKRYFYFSYKIWG